MAPFEFPRMACYMLLVSIFASHPWADIGAQDRIFEPQVDTLAWAPFGTTFGVPNNTFLCFLENSSANGLKSWEVPPEGVWDAPGMPPRP